MHLKSFTEKKRPVIFDIAQCPIIMSDNTIALAGVVGSQLLRMNAVVRGTDDNSVFEGDVVFDGLNFLGVVVYSKGFVMQELDGTMKKIPASPHIKLIEGNSVTCQVPYACQQRSQLLFGYEDTTFNIGRFLCAKDGFIRLSDRNKIIDPSNILYCTGYKCSDKEICFGELFCGGMVSLCGYYPGVKYLNGEFEYLCNLIKEED